MLPPKMPAEGWLLADGSSQACQQVGGDYFDVIQLSPDHWVTVLADVSGKGVSAALLTSLIQGAFFATATLDASELNIPLHRNHHATVVVERPVVREPGWRRHIPWVVPLLLLIATAVALDPRWGWQAEPEQAPIPNGQVDPTGPELSREAIPERTPVSRPTNTADGD